MAHESTDGHRWSLARSDRDRAMVRRGRSGVGGVRWASTAMTRAVPSPHRPSISRPMIEIHSVAVNSSSADAMTANDAPTRARPTDGPRHPSGGAGTGLGRRRGAEHDDAHDGEDGQADQQAPAQHGEGGEREAETGHGSTGGEHGFLPTETDGRRQGVADQGRPQPPQRFVPMTTAIAGELHDVVTVLLAQRSREEAHEGPADPFGRAGHESPRAGRGGARQAAASGAGEGGEAVELGGRHLLAEAGELVVAAAFVVEVRGGPLGDLFDEALADHALERPVQGAGTESHRALGQVLDRGHDPVAVARPLAQRGEDVHRRCRQREQRLGVTVPRVCHDTRYIDFR